MKLIIGGLFCLFIFNCSNKSTEVIEHSTQPVETKNVLNGEYLELHENGQVKTKGNMVNGERDGYWQAFDQFGGKVSESHYKHGKLNGKTASYYHNGKTRYVGYYENDKSSGTWYFYNEDGSFEKEVVYENGKVVK